MKEAEIIEAGITGINLAIDGNKILATITLGDGTELVREFIGHTPDDITGGHLAPNQLEQWSDGAEPAVAFGLRAAAGEAPEADGASTHRPRRSVRKSTRRKARR